MKRILALVLAVMLTLSMLAGCGGKKEDETAQKDRPLALGVVEGDTYTNTYAGLGCTLGKEWTILPADQLQDLPAKVQESMEGTVLGEAMKDVPQFTDMFAENAEQLVNVNVLFQKMSAQERATYKRLSEEEILDETLKQKNLMIESYAAAGIEVVSMEKVKVTFLGEERYALRTTAETQGVPHYMLQLFNYHLGDHAVIITFTSFLEDNTEPMLDLFYAVD